MQPTPSAPKPGRSAGLPSEFESLRTRYRFENDGTGFKEISARIRILNEAGIHQWTQLTFEYKPFSERLEIPYVRVVRKDGRIVKVTADEVVQLPSVPPELGIPKFDYDEKRITVPGLSPGDALEYEVVTVIRHPLARGQFWAQHSFWPTGVVDEQLEIDIPITRKVKVKSKPELKTWVSERTERRIYHWSRPGEREEKSSGVGDATPDIQLTSFASWMEVGRWYAELEKSPRTPSSELRAKADELTNGLNDDSQKVEALYDFAAKKIKYMSLVSLGVGGYVPHRAEETLHNQYGDCKDKVALLAALLEAEGLHASSVLINPDRKIDLDIPSPWPFTHVITTLRLGKEEIWMDPAPDVLPFRMLGYSLRGKQGLLIPPDGVPHFEKTPTKAPVPNTWSEEIDGKITGDGTLDATVKITARGDSELSLREAFIGPVESAWPFTIQGVIKGIKRKADKITDIKISDPAATNEPFSLTFQISSPNFAHFDKGNATFRLPLADLNLPSAEEQGVMDATGDWHRVKAEPVRLGPPGERVYRIGLQLPPGFSLDRLPESVILKHPGGTYQAVYKWDSSSLSAERRLILQRDHLPAQLRNEYAGFRDKVAEDSERSLSARTAD